MLKKYLKRLQIPSDFIDLLAIYLFIVANLGNTLGTPKPDVGLVNMDYFLQLTSEYCSSRKLLQLWLIPFTRNLLYALVQYSILADLAHIPAKTTFRVKAQGELAKMRAMMLK